jgi:predicted GIY-YIG superfamily endonuclease
MKHSVYVLMNEYGIVEYVGETNDKINRMRNHKTPTGNFTERTDLTMEVIKQFDNRKEARTYEGELKLQLGFEWTERTGASKAGKIGGKIGGKIAGRKAVESGRLASYRELQKQSINVYHKDTNEFIGTFESIGECARTLHIQQSNISACLNNRLPHTGGYTFKRETK